MSCNCSSNNCNCSTYTLPSGSAGATGVAGPQGNAGSAGGKYLYNAAVGVSTSTTSFETLYTYTFSNPSSTVSAAKADTAGDKLIFTAYYSTNNIFTYSATEIDKLTRVKFGGLSIVGLTPAFGLGHAQIIYQIELTRVTATSAFMEFHAYRSVGLSILSTHASSFGYSSIITIPSLDSGTPAFIVEADSITAGDISLDWLTIELIKKQ